MDDKRTFQNVMIEYTQQEMARKAESTEKLKSPQVLTPPLRSLFLYIYMKDFTQKWSQISLRAGVVAGTNY